MVEIARQLHPNHELQFPKQHIFGGIGWVLIGIGVLAESGVIKWTISPRRKAIGGVVWLRRLNL